MKLKIAKILSSLMSIQVMIFRFRAPWYLLLLLAYVGCAVLLPLIYIIKEYIKTGGKIHKFFINHPKFGYSLIPIVVVLTSYNKCRDTINSCEMVIFAPEKFR